MDQLKQLIKSTSAKLKEVQKELQVTGKAALKEAFAGVFALHPEVEAFRWEQYTPYFNDGEPCVFSVGDIRVRFAGDAEDVGDYDDGFHILSDWSGAEAREKAVLKTIKPITKLFQETAMEQMLEYVFGDHSEVTIWKNGKITIEEYSHHE